MNIKHYIGFDVHKKSISYCVKTADGKIIEEGKLRATHQVLREWAQKRTEPWHGAMEATLFSSWIYHVLCAVWASTWPAQAANIRSNASRLIRPAGSPASPAPR